MPELEHRPIKSGEHQREENREADGAEMALMLGERLSHVAPNLARIGHEIPRVQPEETAEIHADPAETDGRGDHKLRTAVRRAQGDERVHEI
ncbi:MAG: hypothetical protein QM775_29245 [Pirellulales bacterium]